MKISLILHKLTSIKNFILKNTKTKILSSFILILLITGILLIVLVMGYSYSLDTSIQNAADLIPDSASTFIEITSLENIAAIFPETYIGNEILNSEHWQQFKQGPEMMKISNLLYLLELKTGSVISYENLPDFFSGSVGIAKMKDGSMLITARTNLKSKIGIALLSAYKGEEIPLQEQKQQKEIIDEKGKNIVSGASYKDLYSQQDITLENIKITKFIIKRKPLYITLVNDFIFISDSINLIENSLKIGTEAGKGSLKNIDSFSDIYGDLKNNNIIIYLNNKSSFAAPLLNGFSDADGSAFVFSIEKGKPLAADIFEISATEQPAQEPENGKNTNTVSPIEWENLFSQNLACMVFSKTRGFNEMAKGISGIEGWKSLKEGITGFFSAANIKSDDYFKTGQGLALILNDLELKDEMIYPSFTIGYAADGPVDLLANAVFKVTGTGKKKFQKKDYISLKTEAGSEGFYRPAVLKAGEAILFSSLENDIRDNISSQSGNSPVLSDLRSYRELDDFKDAPHQIIINVPRAIHAFKNFYYYGAGKSGDYSEKTIDKDVVPLLETFSGYKTVHMAFGKNGKQSGRIVLSEL